MLGRQFYFNLNNDFIVDLFAGGAGYDQGCLSCPWVIAEEVLKERGKQ